MNVRRERIRASGAWGTLAAKDETLAELRRQRDEDREREREALAELRRRAEVTEADALRLRLAEVSVPPVVVVAGQEAPEGPARPSDLRGLQERTEPLAASAASAAGVWRGIAISAGVRVITGLFAGRFT